MVADVGGPIGDQPVQSGEILGVERPVGVFEPGQVAAHPVDESVDRPLRAPRAVGAEAVLPGLVHQLTQGRGCAARAAGSTAAREPEATRWSPAKAVNRRGVLSAVSVMKPLWPRANKDVNYTRIKCRRICRLQLIGALAWASGYAPP